MAKNKGKALYKFTHGKVTTDVRYDSVSREFVAYIADKEFTAPTQAVLEDHLRAHIDQVENILWHNGLRVLIANPYRKASGDNQGVHFGANVERVLWTMLDDRIGGSKTIVWTCPEYTEAKRLNRARYLGVEQLPFWSSNSRDEFEMILEYAPDTFEAFTELVAGLDFYRRLVIAILANAGEGRLDRAIGNLNALRGNIGDALNETNEMAAVFSLIANDAVELEQDSEDLDESFDEHADDVLQNQAVMSGQA